MPSDYSINITDDLYISYNLCRFSNKQCGTKYGFANLFSKQDSDCIRLTNSTRYYGIYSSPIGNIYIIRRIKCFLDPKNPQVGVKINYTGGDFTYANITYINGTIINPSNNWMD